MAKFWNITKAQAVIDSASEAADKILAQAKISTIKIAGEDVVLEKAPLAAKVAAVGSLVASGEKSQDVSELIASNGQIAAQVEELSGKLTVANATVASQSQTITAIQGDLATEKASVVTLTAKVTDTANLLRASNDEAARVTALANAQDSEISALCVTAGCLELKGADGKPLAKDASEADKLSAAKAFTYGDKLKAYRGAVNAAIAKTGATPLEFPTTPPGQAVEKKPELKGTDRMKAAIKIA